MRPGRHWCFLKAPYVTRVWPRLGTTARWELRALLYLPGPHLPLEPHPAEQIAQVSWAEGNGHQSLLGLGVGLWRSPPLPHPLTLSGKLPGEAAVGRPGQQPGGGVPAHGEQHPGERAGRPGGKERGGLGAPELRRLLRAGMCDGLESFPGYSLTAWTSRFLWGKSFFQVPRSVTPLPPRPDRPGPVSSLCSPSASRPGLLH